jgi:hypothetical protein
MTDGTFLALIQPHPLPGETIEARYIPPAPGPVVRRFYATPASLLRHASAFRATHHVYFGVALRAGRNGTAAATTRAGACWADIDLKLWAAEPDPSSAALGAIEDFAAPPTMIVATGGGYQPYWALDAPVDVRDADIQHQLESVNAALARAVCGPDRSPDHVQDVARVLRLPGTLNHKPEYESPRPVTVTQFNAEQRYSLASLHALLEQRYPWAIPPPVPTSASARPGHAALPSLADANAVMPSISSTYPIGRRTAALLASTGPAGYQSPSEADAAAAAGLIAAGLTEAEAIAVLQASSRGQDAAWRKGARHVDAYWSRTVTHAAVFVGPISERSAGLRLRAGGRTLPFRATRTAAGPTTGGRLPWLR